MKNTTLVAGGKTRTSGPMFPDCLDQRNMCLKCVNYSRTAVYTKCDLQCSFLFCWSFVAFRHLGKFWGYYTVNTIYTRTMVIPFQTQLGLESQPCPFKRFGWNLQISVQSKGMIVTPSGLFPSFLSSPSLFDIFNFWDGLSNFVVKRHCYVELFYVDSYFCKSSKLCHCNYGVTTGCGHISLTIDSTLM